MISNGAQHQIYTGSDQYLNNAGEGGGQAAESGEQSGGESGGGSTSNPFAIGTVTANGNAITVGTVKALTLPEGETTDDVTVAVNFSNAGDAASVVLHKGNTLVGTEHAVNNGAVNFVASGLDAGTYTIKVKKTDNTLVTTGYQFSLAAASSGGEGGFDPN